MKIQLIIQTIIFAIISLSCPLNQNSKIQDDQIIGTWAPVALHSSYDVHYLGICDYQDLVRFNVNGRYIVLFHQERHSEVTECILTRIFSGQWTKISKEYYKTNRNGRRDSGRIKFIDSNTMIIVRKSSYNTKYKRIK